MPINRRDHPPGTTVRLVDPPHSGVQAGETFTIDRWDPNEDEVYLIGPAVTSGSILAGGWFAHRFSPADSTPVRAIVRYGIWYNSDGSDHPDRAQAYWVAIPGIDLYLDTEHNHPRTAGYAGDWCYWGWETDAGLETIGRIIGHYSRWRGTPAEYTPPVPWIETLPLQERTWRTYRHRYWFSESGQEVLRYAPSQPGPDWGLYSERPEPGNQYRYICRDDNDPCLRMRCAQCRMFHGLDHAWQDHPDRGVFGYNGHKICTVCQANVFTCACGTRSFTRVDTGDDTEVCPNCAEERGYTPCEGCDEWTRNDSMYSGPDDAYRCESCHNDSVSSCDNCGTSCFRDDMDGSGNCSDCRELEYYDDDDGGGVIRGYSDRAANRLGPFGAVRRDQAGRDRTVRFGVELEVEVSDTASRGEHATQFLERIGLDFAVCKDDGSLSNGFEVVTAPADLATHTERWTKALDPMPPGLRSFKTDTCGMHVHVSRKPLSQLQIGKALVFVNAEENKGFITAVAGRTGERWAKRSKKRIKDVRLPADRYQAINITGEHTIEFRIFKGTLKLSAVLKNIEFCHAVMEWCGQESMLRLGWADFTRYVMRTPRLWPNLANWLRTKGYAKAADTAKDKRPDPMPEVPPVPGARRTVNGRAFTYYTAGELCLYPNGTARPGVLNQEGWHWYDTRTRCWYPEGVEPAADAEPAPDDDLCHCADCVRSRAEQENEVPF